MALSLLIRKVACFTKSQLFFVLLVTLTGVVLLSSPIIIVICGLILLYRHIISKLVRWRDPQISHILPPSSAIYSARNRYQVPLCAVACANYLSAEVDRDHVIQTIQNNIISVGGGVEGECCYPELRQRIVTRWGFHFWRNIESFRVENHVRLHLQDSTAPVVVDSEGVLRILEQLLHTPFIRSQSPWEFVIVKNFQDDKKPGVKTVLILRAHHCLADGFSAFNLLAKLSSYRLILRDCKSPGILSYLACVPFGTYEFIRLLLTRDRNHWTKDCVPNNKNKMRILETELISLDTLKELGSRWGVSFSCIINTVYIGGLIRWMKGKKQLAKDVWLSLPVALPHHPDKLTNHYSVFTIRVKLLEDVEILLSHVNAQLEKLKRLPRSVQLLGHPALIYVAGSLPVRLVPHARKVPVATLFLSNFQGPEEPFDLCGYPVEDITAAMTPKENMGFACIAYSYKGAFKFTYCGDQSIYPEEEDLLIVRNGMTDVLNQLMV